MWAYTCYCERSVGSVNSEDSVSSLWGGANSISDGNFKIINYQSLYPCLCLSVFTYHKHIIAIIALTTKERHPPAHRTVNQLRPADIDIINDDDNDDHHDDENYDHQGAPTARPPHGAPTSTCGHRHHRLPRRLHHSRHRRQGSQHL